ncbi:MULTISPECIES: hypothetical protein [unclassified Rhodococcus (in: high G+C Gram-positive bacteria)]|uniref:hypothetical protein n=1 Tax=unclassified Rhodococcus (in: high G+C Gram-positive bacteria) TaxID=192944 RepID=UPI000AB8F6FC|nr:MULTISPECIES: hypothetical protein [unclassified Rhodococcus (in: high G+C Gram-positive bacteria)]MCX6475691.1 hypothetical protein [Rhodococcus sp. (in: high G+C Gram-positive bacteria)]
MNTTTGDTAHQHGNEFPTPAAEPATGFDADNLTAADELAIDIGRVAIEASEGVPYGSEPDEFFLAAGKAVFYWLQLNGHRRITTEEADEIRQVSNCALQYGNIASREAARRLLARFLATEPANVLDPHEGGDWEDAWHTIADLEDCASRAETIAQQENPT